jgi:cytochrome b561
VKDYCSGGRSIARLIDCRCQHMTNCQAVVAGRGGHRAIDNGALDPCGSNAMNAAKSANVDRVLIGATVLIVLAMFATAWLHSISHGDAVKAILLQTHRSLGVTIWVATVLRLAWRLTNATLPPFPIHMTNMHRAIVKASEYCLYALLLIQPSAWFDKKKVDAPSFVRRGAPAIFSPVLGSTNSPASRWRRSGRAVCGRWCAGVRRDLDRCSVLRASK